MVLTVDALTQELQPVPDQPELLIGLATGRVTRVFKGRERIGRIIAYRVVAGEDAVGCPARSDTTPGQTYKLYLKFQPDSGPPIIVRRQLFFDKAGR
ncbi:MAG: hypothetical protein Q8Q88_03210 [Phenylobacterium sp.]|uniref:hypothetical protein n=1 Tax=Phenylobacterium sp. TaxID=1871053 RepID=UPI002737669F|nr:hypothetical protein [Phenylobacterium sp.]MDP3746038.1 hypothetical protein [Phenylobacterium sp.]